MKRNKIDTSVTEDLSIISLIANPSYYNGHKVRVIGYLNLEFEGNGIYLHKEDYEQSMEKNALWVQMSRDSTNLSSIKKCNKHNVIMEGVFENSGGHMELFSGTIKDISRLEIWYPVLGSPAAPKPKLDTIKFPPLKASKKNQ